MKIVELLKIARETLKLMSKNDVPPDSEAGAWTMGYMMRKTVQQIAEPCK